MKVVGFCGKSGVGKTTLMEGVIAGLRERGLRVAAIKHAHKVFDIDHEGKDSWRHRKAGAHEVLVASGHRLAKIREYERDTEFDVHRLLRELSPCDWALIEGFRHGDIPKVEVWRAALGHPPLYPDDPFVVAVATDDPAALPVPTLRPVLRMDDPAALVDLLLASGARHDYEPAIHG